MSITAFTGAAIFDGDRRHHGRALLVDDGRILGLAADADIPEGADVVRYDGGLLAPGFIDAQVNGGGGVLLNDRPDAEGMGLIAAAHRPFGTTGLLPTLITDGVEATIAALAGAAEAVTTKPGVLGLHLEGPHLAPARKGVHATRFMRPLGEDDAERIIAARDAVGTIVLTLATEQAPLPLIRRLADAGVIVNLGHTNASYDDAMAAIDAGARGITHLYNAMSPLAHREPGMVGAALSSGDVWVGMITDGHHVHPAALRIALAAKRGPARCFIVTDAMPTVGVPGDRFELSGTVAYRRDGRLTTADGTLAGADIDTGTSLRYAVAHLDIGIDEALRMLTRYPAEYLRIDRERGRLAPGYAADLVHLDDALRVTDVRVAGRN